MVWAFYQRQHARAIREATLMSSRPASNFAIALGWINGMLIAIILDFTLYSLLGDAYPKGPATVVLVAGCALGGAKLSERLGEKSVRPMAIGLGVLIALYVSAALSVLMSGS